VNERGLVEVPENAVRDEPIAFGLTGVQLGICAIAVLVAAALNLLPIWEPIRLIVIVLGAGPIVLAAALPIRGEPAYRWLVRAVRHRRGHRVWRAELRVADKPQISGAEYGADDLPTGVGDRESGQLSDEAQIEDDAARRQGELPGGQERLEMQDRPPRLRLLRNPASEVAASKADSPATEHSASVPHLLGGVHLVCFLSFAGGVGKTTLAVETASLIGSRARYRRLDGEVRPPRVLLLDAARTSPAAALRLGLDPETVSKHVTRYDWPDTLTYENRVVETRFGVSLLTLPQLPLQGLGPDLPFGPIEAAAILDAAEQAGVQLVVADLGTSLEEGHRHLISQAASVLGIVTPRVEALPDVLRITSYVRSLGAGRKLVLVANRATDDGSLPTLADGEQVPIVATIPDLEAFDAAGDRGVPAWTDDLEIEETLRPLATTVWSLFPGVPSSSEHRLRGLIAGVRWLLRAGDRR
jgi:MinD-like ATPase involved in chromosome partitioning or flagellar assembly